MIMQLLDELDGDKLQHLRYAGGSSIGKSMAGNLMARIRETILEAAPREPLISHHDRDQAVALLRDAILHDDVERQLVCLAAAVEIHAVISQDLWLHCQNKANDSGSAAMRRLFRSARGRSFARLPAYERHRK